MINLCNKFDSSAFKDFVYKVSYAVKGIKAVQIIDMGMSVNFMRCEQHAIVQKESKNSLFQSKS